MEVNITDSEVNNWFSLDYMETKRLVSVGHNIEVYSEIDS